MDENLNLAILVGCGVLLVAVLLVRVASRTGLPVLLLYLGLGLALGEQGAGIEFEDYAVAGDVGLFMLAIILAEGGLTTRWAAVRPVMPFAGTLATIGVIISIGVITGIAMLAIGAELRTAVILGCAVSTTDAAAVFSVLRRLQLRDRVRSVLEAESGINDAPVIVLVVLASSDAWGEESVWHVIYEVLFELSVGLAFGLIIGRLGVELLERLALPAAGLYPLATLALAIGSYSAVQTLHGSGFLAVYVCGLVLGNARLPHRRAVLGFVGSLSLLAEAVLFVLLGLLASPERLDDALYEALVIGAAATFVARPLAVILTATPFRVPWREQVFLSWAGLRGAVPIVVAIIPVNAGLANSERVVDVVFVLVVVYTLIQAPTLPMLGRFLGVVDRHQPTDLEVESAPLEEMGADLLQLTIGAGSQLQGVFIGELRLPKGAQVTLIVRNGTSLVPDRDTQLRADDSLLVVATNQVRAATEARLKAVARSGKLARWREHRAVQPQARRPGAGKGEPHQGEGA